ncbi:histone H1 [Belliella aquatica]|uniref:Histone H1 n=1 Tax=Belliella aquatica TaxID=1323734 RepID=A0ABQ1MBQ2_9BACT|nr:histone H1 [Belliella aquatica]MCH7406348.1 histone H1 [Belliella aquatica]GGC38058.1 histone H1 [Belliella aquatica]
MNRFESIKNMISEMEEDFTKFYENGNKAAGTRVRNSMNNLKKTAQEIRLEVTELKNSKK